MSGQSADDPWRSFLPLDRLKLAPGDTVFLKRGSVWREPLHVHGTGSAAEQIKVGVYGDDGPRPIINPEAFANAAIRIIDASHVTVSGLELSNFHPFHRQVRRYALEAGSWTSASVTGLYFDDLHIKRVRTIANRGDGGSASDGKGGAGLRVVGNIRGESSPNTVTDVRITNCLFEDVEHFAMHLHDIDGIWVANNRTERSGFCATRAKWGVGPTLRTFWDASRLQVLNRSSEAGLAEKRKQVLEFSTDGTSDIAITLAHMSNAPEDGVLFLDSVRLDTIDSVTPYYSWSNSSSLVFGPEGDDDGDGPSNLFEYAFAGDPTDGAARAGYPELEMVEGGTHIRTLGV